jgi:hypothetical protein
VLKTLRPYHKILLSEKDYMDRCTVCDRPRREPHVMEMHTYPFQNITMGRRHASTWAMSNRTGSSERLSYARFRQFLSRLKVCSP